MEIKISIKDVTYTIPSIYLFGLVTIRLLTINNFVALGKLFMDAPLKNAFVLMIFLLIHKVPNMFTGQFLSANEKSLKSGQE